MLVSGVEHVADVRNALLDVQEVMKILKVGEWAVRSLVYRGKLRAVRVGRHLRFVPSEVDRFVAANRTPSAGERP